jgi:soluble lytic murein transglycosylase-like protein
LGWHLAGLWIALAACQNAAADVYQSVGPDGTVRFASQPLDRSYSLVLRDTPSAKGSSVRATTSQQWLRSAQMQPLFERIATRYGVHVALVEAVAAIESANNPLAVSPRGARGVMQLMPDTARTYGVTDPRALDDPERNIDAGVRHLKDLLAQHQNNVALALAAYNAGSGAVAKHGMRIPPYRETMLYVPAVLGRMSVDSSTGISARP